MELRFGTVETQAPGRHKGPTASLRLQFVHVAEQGCAVVPTWKAACRSWSFITLVGVEAVGVRLRDGDDFPYLSQDGFPVEFIEAEDALAERLEIHYTPKHGSWLNMAEIEFSALNVQCLDRRIADTASLRVAIRAWEEDRNGRGSPIDWRFTADDARIKLRKLYPNL